MPAGAGLNRTADDTERALTLVQQRVEENDLTLHTTKTRISNSRTESFDFLGYSFQGQDHLLRKKGMQKSRDAIREKTPRTTVRSQQCTIADVNQTLKGWLK